MSDPTELDFPASGRVIESSDGMVVFAPANTNYALRLSARGGEWTGEANRLIAAIIRLKARKVMTVPSGGNFVQPIVGPPRIVQGRVRFLTERWLAVRAGCLFIVDLPGADSCFDLNHGAIRVGTMVNVAALPGATIEPAPQSSAPSTPARHAETIPQ